MSEIIEAVAPSGTKYRFMETPSGVWLNVWFEERWIAVMGAHPPIKDIEIILTWVTGGNVRLTYEDGKQEIERFGNEKRSKRRRKRYKREDNRYRLQYYRL